MSIILKKILAYTLAILSPAFAIYIGLAVMVFADLFTGIWASLKRGEKLKSKLLAKTIYKLLAYMTLLAIVAMFDHWFLVPVVGRTIFFNCVALFLGFREFWSLIENFQHILNIPDLPAVIKNIVKSKTGLDN